LSENIERHKLLSNGNSESLDWKYRKIIYKLMNERNF
jgi:hypothetical protein